MKKIRVAIIGQGRSGRDIHGAYFKSADNENYEVVAVVEADEQRRNRALEEYPGCRVYADYTELFGADDIDLVVNASFSEMHYPISKDLLKHKFNVLVEKPMGRSYYECSDLIKTAKDNGVIIAAFQQSFFAPHYIHAKDIVESGKIGELLQVSVHYNNFARRWDWQTLHSRAAGGLFNTGPHPVGLALGFIDFDPNAQVVFSRLGQAMTSGDSDDYAKLIITAPGRPVVDIEVSSNDAFAPFKIKLQGTKGTYMCDLENYQMKYVVDGENPEKPVIYESLRDENGYPIYCKEDLVSHEEGGKISGELFSVASKSFYAKLYDTLVNGAPLAVPVEHVAMITNVIATAHAQNPTAVKFF